jgi:hypothetical protein
VVGQQGEGDRAGPAFAMFAVNRDQRLRKPVRSKPLAGKTPIAHITSASVAGARDALRLAAQEGLRGSMA